MIILGNSKRACISGWILAAFLLLGVNGFALFSLFNPPLVGRSQETRLASQKFHRLENSLAVIQKEAVDNIDLQPIAARFSPDLSVVTKQLPDSRVLTSESEAASEGRLPILSGIMKISDAHGNHRLFALIEGKRLMENDRVGDFTVQKITDAGVVLSKNGETWFVPAPEVHFSVDREG
jgi:hypothetical protein